MSEKEFSKYWKYIDVFYMTEESDDPENPNTIVEHKLSWRSRSKLVKLSLYRIFLLLFMQS